MSNDRDPADIFRAVLEEDANDPFLQHDYDDSRGKADFVDGMDVALGRERRAHEIAPQDDLARAALIDQEIQEETTRKTWEAPRISGAPPSAIKGIMGGEVVVSSTDPTPRSIASWTADVDAEARPVVVAVGPSPQVTSVAAGQLRAFVRVRYGTQRGFLYVDADLGTGVMLTVPASAIEVLFGLDPDASGAQLAAYTLTVALAFGRVTRSVPLTRTSYLDSIATGAANLKNIIRPLSATTLAAFERADPTAQYKLDFKDVQGTIRYTRIIAASTYLNNPVYLANDIVSVDVTNQGTGTDQARAIFGLSVG